MTDPERDPSAEADAHAVLADYAATHPFFEYGKINADIVQRWYEQITAPPRNPEDLYIYGHLQLETAFGELLKPEDARSPDIATGMLQAAETFATIANHPSLQVSPLLRAQALMSQGSAELMTVHLNLREDPNAYAHYLSLQARAGGLVLQQLRDTGSAQAAMMADSLSLIMVLGQQKTNDIGVAYMVPPRIANPPVDGFYRANAFIVHGSGLWRVRIGPDGPDECITLPPEIFQQDRFASDSGYGTMQAIIKEQLVIDEYIKHGTATILQRKGSQIQQAGDHATRVGDLVRAAIKKEQERIRATSPTKPLPEPGDNWYRELYPLTHPITNREHMDNLIGAVELKVAEETATTDERLELAQMYVEIGIGRTILGLPTAQLVGDFDRAEDVLAPAVESLRLATTEREFTLLMQAAAIPMLRSLATGQEVPEAQAAYMASLGHIGRRLLEVVPKDPRAYDPLVQQLTAILLTNLAAEGGIVAVAPTERQSGPAGWDVSVYPETMDGFIIARPGRIRLSNKEAKWSRSNGIVTATPHHLGQQQKSRRTVTLQALVNRVQGGQANQKDIDTAWRSFEKVVVAADA